MIVQFKNLTESEINLLLKAPVIVSVLALSEYDIVNKTQKEDAIKLAHLKTFTENILLQPYYDEVEKIFKIEFERIANNYFPVDESYRTLLKNEMTQINLIIDNKLDENYGRVLHKSLEGYAAHVKRSAHNVFQDLIFPITFSRL